MKKTLACFISVSVFFSVLVLTQKDKGKAPSITKPHTGAFYALQEWNAARSFPADQAQGFHQAYQHMKRDMQPVRQTANLKASEPWEPIGPINFGGRTLALEIDPNNPNIVWAGAASGGLWRIEDISAEASWQFVETGFPVLGVSAIEIDPNDSQTMYIGTGEVYGYGTPAHGLNQRYTRGSYGIGILKSSDGGVNWDMCLDWRNAQTTGIQDIEIDPNQPETIWAATSEGVYKSQDGGKSWQESLAVTMAVSLSLDPSDANTLLVSCGGLGSEGNGLYKTSDGGESWQKITAGLPDHFEGKMLLDRSTIDSNRIYASIGNRWRLDVYTRDGNWLVRSDDNGETWTTISTFDYSGVQGWYSHYVKELPSERLIVGGVSPYYSDDNGQSMIQTDGPVDNHAVAVHPTNPDIIYYAADNGIYKSTDGGLTMAEFVRGLSTIQFYKNLGYSHTDEDFLAGTAQDRFGHFIYEGDPDWRWSGVGHEAGYVTSHSDSRFYYLGYYFNFYLYFSNSTASWAKEIPDHDPFGRDSTYATTVWNAPLMAAPNEPGRIYAARDKLYFTNNKGNNWISGNNGDDLDGNPILSMDISATNKNLVYVATVPRYDRMHVYRSTNAGRNFSDITGDLPNRYPTSLTVDPSDDDVLYLTLGGFGSSHLYKSSDGGQSWIDIDRGALPDIHTADLVIDPLNSDHLYVGNDLGVFVTTEGGGSWSLFTEGLPNTVQVADLIISPGSRKIRVATHGSGVFSRQLLEADDSEPATTLVYPWISNRADQFESILVVNNPSDQLVDVQLQARRKNGELETTVRSIRAGGFLEESASSLFPRLGSGDGYTVTLTSPNADILGSWVTNNLQAASGRSPSQGVAVRVPRSDESNDSRLGSAIVFGYLPTSGDFISAPVVVNCGLEPIDVTLTLFNQAGNQLGSKVLQDLEPGVPFAEVANSLIDNSGEDVYMIAESSGMIAGVSFVFDLTYGETAIGNAAVMDTAAEAKTLLYPWISNNADAYESILVANNYSNEQVTVTLTARRENGESEQVTRAIPAQGFLAESASALFPTLGSGPGYSVTLAAPHGAVQGQWVTNNLQAASGHSPSQGVAVDVAATNAAGVGEKLLFSYLPTTAAMKSAPVIVNLGATPADVTLNFYDRHGKLIPEATTVLTALEPLRPFARLANTLLPQDAGNVTMIATSDGAPIAGVGFVFNDQWFEPAIGNATRLK